MQKKIVVLTGSPRKNGNSVLMAEAFISEAEKEGHTVTRFDTAFLDISPCRACGGCFQNGKPCAQSDDYDDIAPAIIDADVVVFITPLYWFTFPAQIKNAIDRFFCFLRCMPQMEGKECALIASSGHDTLTAMDGLLTSYAHIANMLHWRCAGEVLVTGTRAPGAVSETDGCQQAAALARKLSMDLPPMHH